MPEKTGLGLEGPGLKPGDDDVDGTGDKVKVFTTNPIAAGGTLALTVTNIPARARTGRIVATVPVHAADRRGAGGRAASARGEGGRRRAPDGTS